MLDRRQFLGAAAGAALTFIRTAHADLDATSQDPRALAHPELLAAVGPHVVCEIGLAYRACVPTEQDRASLEAALRAELPAAGSSNADLVRADFDAGRVIVVDGWVLSRTEARQCALYSLRSA